MSEATKRCKFHSDSLRSSFTPLPFRSSLSSYRFIVAALLLMGCVPVPVFPPDPLKLKVDAGQFSSIVKSSGATVALTNGQYNYAKKLTSLSASSKVRKETASTGAPR